MFRTCAASAAAVYGATNPYLGSAVLHNGPRQIAADVLAEFAFNLETMAAVDITCVLNVNDTGQRSEFRCDFGNGPLDLHGDSFRAL